MRAIKLAAMVITWIMLLVSEFLTVLVVRDIGLVGFF